MNKHTIVFLFLLFFGAFQVIQAQDSLLLELNTNRLQLNKINMYVLGGWAVGNIALGGVMRSQTTGTNKYFHEMNMFWNLVNLGLAGGGLYAAYTTDPAALDMWESIQQQDKLERILLFNLALNFTYLTAGGYLIERSKNANNKPERLKGYGQSLILQGGFLLLFDATQYLMHHAQARPKLESLLSHIDLQLGAPFVLSLTIY
ncbi:MAG: hypothetical protein AAF587_17455 [Bacteroidota bacterium]